MRDPWMKKIGMVATVFLLLVMLPVSAMAQKGTGKVSGIGTAAGKATPSDAWLKTATPSDADAVDGELINDLESAQTLPEEEEKEIAEAMAGTWAADEVTSYRFDKDGTGSLLLPEHAYDFAWTMEEDTLILEFENSRIGTASFLFTLEEDALSLARLDTEAFAEVVLSRSEQEP